MAADAVLSYHLNPLTCGVAKFNHELARQLGVPCLPLVHRHYLRYQSPVVSVKMSEIEDDEEAEFPRVPYDLILHDRPRFLPRGCRRVFYAEDVGCPSTIFGNAHRGRYRVLAFGMAHKFNLAHFVTLKHQLDRDHPDYTIELSTAVHEGTPWDGALTITIAAMRTLFGDRLRVLGYLGDDALAKELRDVDAVALFYDPALRANNTTYWAAVDAKKTIFTNRDDQSPQPGDPLPTWGKWCEVLNA